jgi:hypothetical protein
MQYYAFCYGAVEILCGLQVLNLTGICDILYNTKIKQN